MNNGTRASALTVPYTILFALERHKVDFSAMPKDVHLHVVGAAQFEAQSDWRELRSLLVQKAPQVAPQQPLPL